MEMGSFEGDHGVKKGPWTPEEDLVLFSYIKEHGPGNWRHVPHRTGNILIVLLITVQCSCGRESSVVTLPPRKTKSSSISNLSCRWAAIASYLPQRTDNDIKNHWNTHLKKNKLRKIETAGGRHGGTAAQSSAASSRSRGQWERCLQTDIHEAKRALNEALSMIEKPIGCGRSLSAASDVDPVASEGEGGGGHRDEAVGGVVDGWRVEGSDDGSSRGACEEAAAEAPLLLLERWLFDESDFGGEIF